MKKIGALVQQLRSSTRTGSRGRSDLATIVAVREALDYSIVRTGSRPTETGDAR